MLMTVMFHDIHKDDKVKILKQRMPELEADEILYTDDTICITRRVPAISRLIKEIEKEGREYGVKFNYEKCEYICFGIPDRITYDNSTQVSKKDEVKYLGVIINDHTDIIKEVAAKSQPAI